MSCLAFIYDLYMIKDNKQESEINTL